MNKVHVCSRPLLYRYYVYLFLVRLYASLFLSDVCVCRCHTQQIHSFHSHVRFRTCLNHVMDRTDPEVRGRVSVCSTAPSVRMLTRALCRRGHLYTGEHTRWLRRRRQNLPPPHREIAPCITGLNRLVNCWSLFIHKPSETSVKFHKHVENNCNPKQET